MQKGQYPIYNGTLEIFDCPSSKITFLFKHIETFLFKHIETPLNFS